MQKIKKRVSKFIKVSSAKLSPNDWLTIFASLGFLWEYIICWLQWLLAPLDFQIFPWNISTILRKWFLNAANWYLWWLVAFLYRRKSINSSIILPVWSCAWVWLHFLWPTVEFLLNLIYLVRILPFLSRNY